MAELGKIKGVAFSEFLAWHETRNGSHGAREAVRAVESRHRQGLDDERTGFGVLASKWYAAEAVHDLVDRLIVGTPPSELDALASDAAQFIMGRTLKGVYRAVFSMFGTPDRYARYINKLWGMHYDTGTVVVQEPSPGVHVVRYVKWTGHHSFICRMNMASSLALYGAMGCRDVHYQRVACVSSGSAHCENSVRWKK